MAKKEKFSFGKMRSIFLFSLIIFLSLAFLYILSPFFFPLFWAAVAAITFYPLYKLVNKYVKIDMISSLITVIIFIVLVFLPLTLISFLFINESSQLYKSFNQEAALENIKGALASIQATPLAPFIEQFQSEWTRYASIIVNFLTSEINAVLVNIGVFIIQFLLMLYILYYFLKDGEKILKRIMHLSPLSDKYERKLYDQFTSTTRATLKSTLIIGGVQGVLGGLLFWFTGIQGAFVWAIIMIILSLIPAVGPLLVWLPAGIFMLVTGHVWEGLTILIIGATVISVIDNLLRPPLIGRDIQMHPVIVLLSTLGGIIFFGVSGFIIGPIIAALFISIMSIYDYYYRNELENN